MDQARLSWLMSQYMAVTATPQEMQELTSLVYAGTDQELFKTVLAGMMVQETPVAPAQEAVWQQMVREIISIDKPTAKRPARVVGLYKWVAAAVVLIFAGLALYYYLLPSKPSSIPATDRAPALAVTPVNRNVLTLSDGSPVLLDEMPDSRVVTQHNTIVVKNGNQLTYSTKAKESFEGYNVLSTANSKLYQVVLPDGSRVWLNAASSIRFPVSFDERHERLVELSGEAWFDVEHDQKKPFLIRSGSITTTVLGTAFDVKAYPDQQSMIVSVQRGVVRVRSGDKILTTLTKGQQVRVQSDNSFTRQEVDTLSIAAWKQGSLVYKDEKVKDIIADLQRVFNHSIIIKRSSLQQEMIKVSFNKGTGIRQALEIICRITDARLTEQQGTFIIE